MKTFTEAEVRGVLDTLREWAIVADGDSQRNHNRQLLNAQYYMGKRDAFSLAASRLSTLIESKEED